MSRRWVLAAVAAALLSAQSAALAGEVLENLPRRSNLVARADVSAIFSSELVRRELIARKYQYEALNSLFSALFGVDFEQIETLWLVSSTPAEALFLLEGQFAPDAIAGKLRELPGLTTMAVEGIPHVSQFRGGRDDRIKQAVILNEGLLAVGDAPQVTPFLNVWRGGEVPLSKAAPALARIAASRAHLTATLLDPRRWPEIDPGTAELVTETWLSARVGADVDTVFEVEGIDGEAARGFRHLLRGFVLLAPKHPQVRHHSALVAAFENAVLKRDGAAVSLHLTFPGALIAADLGRL